MDRATRGALWDGHSDITRQLTQLLHCGQHGGAARLQEEQHQQRQRVVGEEGSPPGGVSYRRRGAAASGPPPRPPPSAPQPRPIPASPCRFAHSLTAYTNGRTRASASAQSRRKRVLCSASLQRAWCQVTKGPPH